MAPSFIQDDPIEPLRLRAEDVGDLGVISACLQDAVTRQSDMSYRPREHRFAIVLNRYRWEREAVTEDENNKAHGDHQRIRTGVHFDGCLGVKTKGLDGIAGDEILLLLPIECELLADGTAEVDLVFTGGATIKMFLECIDCQLRDLSEPWEAQGRPDHPLDAAGGDT